MTEHTWLNVWIDWSCPHCKSVNMDNPSMTVVPMCEYCLKNFEWHEITDEPICSCQLETGKGA